MNTEEKNRIFLVVGMLIALEGRIDMYKTYKDKQDYIKSIEYINKIKDKLEKLTI